MQLGVPDKKCIMQGFLASGYVRVHVDPRRPGVDLPAQFLKDVHVGLDYGMALSLPTEDVQLTDDGIRCTLSFYRTPTPTFVPWSAVFYLEHPECGAVTWLDDYPPELRARLEEVHALAEGEKTEEAPPAKRARPDWLKVI